MRGAWREGAGWVAAAAVAIVVVGLVASTARADLLFRDGDSLVVALVTRSLVEGRPLDWAFSSVLFLPETALLLVLRIALPWLPVASLLAVNAVLNLLALYGALRLAAGRRRPGTAPVAWSLTALVAFGGLAVTETSASRDALEPASLLLTTTYYSATVIGALLAAGIVRRRLDSSAGRGHAVTLGAVALLSTTTNPLFLAWAAAPLAVLLAIAAIPRFAGRPALALLVALTGGSVLGLVARIPFSAWIANTGVGYAQPELWRASAGYYGELAADRLRSPGGLIAAVLIVALLAACALRSIRSSDPGTRLVAAYGWFAPAAVVCGAIALGTHAARYLEPVAFAPLLGLVAAPAAVRTLSPALRRGLAGAAALGLAVAAVLAVPRVHAAATAPDADAACVVDWVNASDRTGAGQFWTVRLPKLLLDDASQLVQVDHTLRGYAWLVNRADFSARSVTFLVEDPQTVRWDIAGAPEPDAVIGCGRYRILDFASHPLPIGPQRS